MFSRLFTPRRRKNREDVAARAADVIAQVLTDIGIDRFLNGSLLLDRQFRPRFFSVLPACRPDILASVAVRELDEAHILRACVPDGALDAATAARHARFLGDGLMRELLARSPDLRALPLRRAGRARRALVLA